VAHRDLAPVVVYTYSRLAHLQRTIEALQRNFLASRTVLYVVSDGPKNADHKPFVDKVRDYADGVSGFRDVIRIYRDKNLGTPASIHQAEKQVVHDHGTVISMEDDNISAPNYLDFLNSGVQAYWDDPSIFSVCGYCPPIPIPSNFGSEYWFYPWNLSWGYALWKHKYDKVYPLVNDLPAFKREGLLRKVRSRGGLYITDSLMRDFKKKSIFPDAVLCAKMTREDLRSVIPIVSKIRNIGSDGSGVSGSRLAAKHDTRLDDRDITDFQFGGAPPLNDRVVRAMVKFQNSGILTRISRRLGVYHELSAFKYWLKARVLDA
jgi:hypothetical protein